MVHRTKHRTESPELQAAGEESLHESLRRINDIGDDWFQGFVVETGSPIADVDHWTTTEHYADQLLHLAVSSRDHLGFLNGYIVATEGSLPTMSGYTLIRASIEASECGFSPEER